MKGMSIPPSPAIAPQTSSFPSHHPGQARRVPREDRQGQAWEGLKFCQTHLSEEAPQAADSVSEIRPLDAAVSSELISPSACA